MTIDEMIEALETAKEILGGETEIKIASQAYGSSMLQYGVHELACGATMGGVDDEEIIDLKRDAVWIVEGTQDRENPYGVPALVSVDEVS